MAHNEISDIKYVVIDCGYTDRLIEYVDEIQEEAGCWDAKLLQLADNTYETTDFHVEEMLEFIREKSGYLKGPAVFECDSIDDAFRLCENLMEYGHCGCFSFGTMYKMCQLEYENNKVLLLKFDTESG
ncbi:Hypothetical protein PACV_206 [Pacmanvirus A23]|uniref:Hypothetical protein n=1 Tax=Pacmanvirus A23 TaxID=1932881 RepID=UPI000A091E10|nr:Hypothetical protein B9W72_gp204 [Pacmanvirus A23]SIP85921.1 Hypothetical protein PACV_206 [Pacmanvirus A23]